MAESKIYVLSGGPGTGKTSVINELSKKFKVIPEAARKIGDNYAEFKGKSIKEIEMSYFQKMIFEFYKEEYSKNDEDIVFSDRGFGDTLAYYNFHKLKIPDEDFNYAKNFKCTKIFIPDFLNFYETDKLRQESLEEQREIQDLIIKMYEELGCKPVIVPFGTIQERVEFIQSNM